MSEYKRVKYRRVLIFLCAATVLFIWINSLMDEDASADESRAVLEAVATVVETVSGVEMDTTDDLWLRKTAHFCEFALLGAELALLILPRSKKSFQGVCNCLFPGLLVAVCDESLQLLSNRGSQLPDVLLDFSGVITAVLLVTLLDRWKNRAGQRQEP